VLSVVICVGPVICVLDKEISEASSGVDSLKDEEMGIVDSELAEPIGISVVEMAVSEAMDSVIIVAIVDEKVSVVSEEPDSADNEELDVDCSGASE